jgi:hypothetical protein
MIEKPESPIPNARQLHRFEQGCQKAVITQRPVVKCVGGNPIRFWVDDNGVLKTALLAHWKGTDNAS